MSDVALQLIAENKKTRATFLDLGDLNLIEIPAEIQELVWLEVLTLASVWYEWDGQNWQTHNSQNNPLRRWLRSFSPISPTKITDCHLWPA
jgi:hypothetical protein